MKYLLLISSIFLFSCDFPKSSGSSNSDGHLYLRTYMWTGMYGSNLDISWIMLSDDGQIVRNPKHGVNPVDWAKENQDNVTNVGTYQEKDGKLEIKWSDGKTASWSVERKDGDISIIDGGIISEPDAVSSDYKLNGQYAASTVLPNVANIQTLIFKKDGTFTTNSLGTVSTADVSGSSENSDGGTYNITGNTLTLTFAKGSVQKSVICIWDMDGKKNLVINSRYFPEEKKGS